MTRLALALTAAGILVALVVPTALGKGASEATITGPGLGDGLSLAGEGQVGGDRTMRIAEAAGFFPAVYGQTPNPMLGARPQGDLGPRYTIVYVLPGPSGGADRLRQELYPYAEPCAVTHMAKGQRYYGMQRTVGGWFLGCRTLEDLLVRAGLPATPPAGGSGDFPWTIACAVTAFLVVLSAGIVLGVRRSRPGPVVA